MVKNEQLIYNNKAIHIDNKQLSMFITACILVVFRMDAELTTLRSRVIINNDSYIVTNMVVINNTN